MKVRFCPIIKAIPALAAGAAFFLLSCHPGVLLEKSAEREALENLFAMAERDFQAGAYDKAYREYQGYLEKKPKGKKSRIALYRMAKISDNNHFYEETLSLLKRIMREYPNHRESAIVKYDIANTYYRLGDYHKSNTEALDWLKRYPKSALKENVLFLLGKNFEGLGNNPEAFRWWLKASEEFRDTSVWKKRINEKIFSLISNSHIDELKEMAEHASGSGYAPHIHHRMATLYLEDHKPEEARVAAMSLVRSTTEQSWVSTGRQLLDRIDQELSLRACAIGCLLPLSGPFAIYGQEVLNGIQLGMGMFNEPEEDHCFELIVKDTAGRAEDAIWGVEELALKEKVMAIIGPLASKPALAAAKKAQELGIPIITLTQRDGITAEGEMVFRNFLTPSKEVKTLLDKMTAQRGLNRFAILYPDNSYGRFFMNLFWDGVEQMGGVITAVESYHPDETDFAAQIKKMVGLYYPRPEPVGEELENEENLDDEQDEDEPDSEEEPEPIVDFDAVFIPDNHHKVALIAPHFPFHNVFNILFLGTSLWQSSELIETSGDYVQGAIFPSGFFEKSSSETIKEFVELYKENFETEPGALAANGYDTTRFLKRLKAERKIRTREDFLKALLTHDSFFYGVTGRISFDAQGEVEKDPILLTISGRHLYSLP